MPLDPKTLRLCLVTDRALARGRPLAEIVGAAVRGGATLVQLREKTATTRVFVEEARALKSLLTPLGVGLIINDRPDIALAVDAEGLHVGQSDMPVEDVRRLLGPDKIIRLSITNAAEIGRPDAGAADYLGIGPVYPQHTKDDAAPSLGVEGFSRLRAMTKKPVVAIDV
jgi:thiamine-phosphate pyrophosphorylase